MGMQSIHVRNHIFQPTFKTSSHIFLATMRDGEKGREITRWIVSTSQPHTPHRGRQRQIPCGIRPEAQTTSVKMHVRTMQRARDVQGHRRTPTPTGHHPARIGRKNLPHQGKTHLRQGWSPAWRLTEKKDILISYHEIN